MTPALAQLRQRIDALPQQQRMLVFLALIALLYLIADLSLFAPLAAERQQLQQRIATLQQEIAADEQQAREALRLQNIDPNADAKRQHQQLSTQIEALDRQIAGAVEGLIAPQQMAQVLEEVIRRQAGLKLHRIESIAARPLLEATDADPAAHDTGIWRHGVRLEFDGDYAATLAYLRELQGLPWRLHWEELEITMQKYPQARVIIVVHTLSLREGWIGV